MLEGAKVTISLDDLDELRLKDKHYDQLLRDISSCVIFQFDEYTKELDKISKNKRVITEMQEIELYANARKYAEIIIDTGRLTKILLNNCALNKTDNEMCLFESLDDPKVIYNLTQEGTI
ncbi:MAG: hypothetical protein ABFC57_18480 [Veillonellales bacterium]